MTENHSVKVEFDSVEERPQRLYLGNRIDDPPFVVKYKIYNHGLFSLNAEITEYQNESAGAVAIVLPGRVSRTLKRLRNFAKRESSKPNFYPLEIGVNDPSALLNLHCYNISLSFKNAMVSRYSHKFNLSRLVQEVDFALYFPARRDNDDFDLDTFVMPTVEGIREHLQRLSENGYIKFEKA